MPLVRRPKHAMRPLRDLRVLEFSHHLAGPAVGMILADLGAEVIKVARPGLQPSSLDAVLDRGKRVVTLDLKAEKDRARARTLARGADVVIENFRPGVMERLGLGADELASENASLIHLSLPGFSRLDRERASMPGWEGIILAAAGVLAERGASHRLRGNGPAFLPMTMASAYAAAYGTVGVLAALYGRLRDGSGERIEVPLYNALLEGLSYNHLKIENLPERYLDLRAHALRQRGDAPLPEAEVQTLIDPLYRSYRCSDGRSYYLAVPPHRRLVEATLDLFGLWRTLETEGVPKDEPYRESREWLDPASGSVYAMPKLARHWTDRIFHGLAQEFAKAPAAEWERRCGQSDLAGAVVRTTEEWLETDHARRSGLAIELDDSKHGRVKQLGPVAWVAGDTIDIAARRFEDASTIDWAAKGFGASKNGTERIGSPLDGITILDLTNVIAGPTIAGTLARFGARVIKIDGTTPHFDPFITVGLALQAGRGKESLLLDLKEERGRKILDRLIARADLITFNGTASQIRALGLDQESLRRVNPRTCLVQLSAFGGPREGPMSAYKGFDEVLQAATGIMARLTPPGTPPEEYAQFGTVDVITGVCGAVAALASLIAREREGVSQQAATSLAAGAALMQLPFMVSGIADGAEADPPYGREEANYAVIRAADGWLFLGAERARLPSILTALDAGGPGSNARERIAQACLERPIAEIEAHLTPTGAAVHRLMDYESLRARHRVDESGAEEAQRSRDAFFVRYRTHPLALELAGQCAIRFARRPVRFTAPSPKYGRDTLRILDELGLTTGEIERLRQAHVVAETWPHHSTYLPG
ncbi:MAG: CoA transferase [Alphaproteobacteria bacterium]